MEKKPHFYDHRKRLRERFKLTDGKGMQDYELLELLLTYAIPRRDVKPMAKDLIKRYGTVSGVLDAPMAELERFPGLGEVSATLVRLLKRFFEVYAELEISGKNALTSPDAVIAFSRTKIGGLNNEVFLTIYVNTKNEVVKHEMISEGTVNRVAVFPRKIVETALSCHATGVILVHNHPAGNLRPSKEDIALTRSIVEATKTLDIRVLDHIIVAKSGHYSFMDNNRMPKVL